MWICGLHNVMNRTWFFLILAAVGLTPVPARDARRAGRNLDLFFPRPANETPGCPSARPESCDCESFRGRDSAK